MMGAGVTRQTIGLGAASEFSAAVVFCAVAAVAKARARQYSSKKFQKVRSETNSTFHSTYFNPTNLLITF